MSVCGDVEDVEIELGLRTHRVTPARRYNVLEAFGRANFDAPVLAPPVQRQPKPKLGRNEKCFCGVACVSEAFRIRVKIDPPPGL